MNRGYNMENEKTVFNGDVMSQDDRVRIDDILSTITHTKDLISFKNKSHTLMANDFKELANIINTESLFMIALSKKYIALEFELLDTLDELD